MAKFKPEDDEIDVQPYEGPPDYDRPQHANGKQDD